MEPNRDQLNEITNEDNKGIKKKPETSVRKFDTELNITADEFNQVNELSEHFKFFILFQQTYLYYPFNILYAAMFHFMKGI